MQRKESTSPSGFFEETDHSGFWTHAPKRRSDVFGPHSIFGAFRAPFGCPWDYRTCAEMRKDKVWRCWTHSLLPGVDIGPSQSELTLRPTPCLPNCETSGNQGNIGPMTSQQSTGRVSSCKWIFLSGNRNVVSAMSFILFCFALIPRHKECSCRTPCSFSLGLYISQRTRLMLEPMA